MTRCSGGYRPRHGPLIFLGDIGVVAGLANLMLLVVFVLVNAALLKLRYSRPELERGFRTPLNVGRLSVTAVAGLLSSLGLSAFYILPWDRGPQFVRPSPRRPLLPGAQ